MEKYLGHFTTKRGVEVDVWVYSNGDWYAERHQIVKKSTGGYKEVVTPYKVTKEIKEHFAERVAEIEAEEA